MTRRSKEREGSVGSPSGLETPSAAELTEKLKYSRAEMEDIYRQEVAQLDFPSRATLRRIIRTTLWLYDEYDRRRRTTCMHCGSFPE